MTTVPKKIRLNEIADVISDRFSGREAITCYLGSNAATPTASIESLTRAIEARAPRLPFIRMVHLLTQGPVPYVAEGLQDRIMTYSIFSGGSVREAANEGRAFYLPCTLANIGGLIGKGQKYEPEIVIMGSRELYDYVHMRSGVQMRPASV